MVCRYAGLAEPWVNESTHARQKKVHVLASLQGDLAFFYDEDKVKRGNEVPN